MGAGIWSLDGLNFWLYANLAGLTETFSRCTASPGCHRVGLWVNICPASLGKAIFSITLMKASLQSEQSHLALNVSVQHELLRTSPQQLAKVSIFLVTVVESLLLTVLVFSRGFKNCKVYFFRCFTSMWKRAEVLHLCEIWNISSKYIKAQCLINVFRIQMGRHPRLFSFSVSGHAVNRCMFFVFFCLFFSCDPVLFVQKQSNKDYIWLELWPVTCLMFSNLRLKCLKMLMVCACYLEWELKHWKDVKCKWKCYCSKYSKF